MNIRDTITAVEMALSEAERLAGLCSKEQLEVPELRELAAKVAADDASWMAV